MNGAVLEQQSLAEISDHQSTLSKHGRYLAQEIAKKLAYRLTIIYIV